jgi:hypothetical protein
LGSDRLVERPATQEPAEPIEILTVPKRGGRWRSGRKELKKLGEAIYGSAQKFSIWDLDAV